MRTIETTATITADGKVILEVPPDIQAGKHKIVLVIDEQLFMEEKPVTQDNPPVTPMPLNLPVINVGSWPVDFSLRREDMYDEWGR